MHMSHMVSVHSSVDGHIVWFHFFANVNHEAIGMMCKDLWGVLTDSFRDVSKSAIGHIANSSIVIFKISLINYYRLCVCVFVMGVVVGRMPCGACVAQRTSLLSQFFPSRFHGFQGSDSSSQPCMACSFTCLAILPASVFSFFEMPSH